MQSICRRVSACSWFRLEACVCSPDSTTLWPRCRHRRRQTSTPGRTEDKDIPLAALPLNHDARHDRYWAGGVSGGLHLLALLWTLTAASTLSEGSSVRDTTSGLLSMTLLGEDEFRQPLVIAKTTPQAERPELIPVEPLSVTPPTSRRLRRWPWPSPRKFLHPRSRRQRPQWLRRTAVRPACL